MEIIIIMVVKIKKKSISKLKLGKKFMKDVIESEVQKEDMFAKIWHGTIS